MLTLVLGGARSGKSAYAERLALAAEKAGGRVTYVATAAVRDDEMAERIAHHRSRRPAHWKTIEEPINLAGVLDENAVPGGFLLVDCLTLWLSNLMLAETSVLPIQRASFIAALKRLNGDVVLVSNEVGLGIVPETPLGRRFIDESGRLHQEIGAIADHVAFIAAGLPMILK